MRHPKNVLAVATVINVDARQHVAATNAFYIPLQTPQRGLCGSLGTLDFPAGYPTSWS